MKKIILLLCMLCALLGARLNAQAPGCLAAGKLNPIPKPAGPDLDTTISAPQGEKWFKFTAIKDSVLITLSSFLTGTGYRTNKVELYKGSCSSLTLLQKDSLSGLTDSTFLVGANNLLTTDTIFIRTTCISNSFCGSCGNTNMKYRAQIYFVLDDPFWCLTCTTMTNCNLVCNGDFEQYSPNGVASGYSNILDACGWSNLTLGSCDFFHASVPASGATSVPCNFLGTQTTNTLTTSPNYGYAGFQAYPSNTVLGSPDAFAEYMKTKLLHPLVPFTTYTVSFWLSQAEGGNLRSDSIGVLLYSSPASITVPTAVYTPLAITPTKKFGVSTLPYNSWVQYSFTYTPTIPGIQYLAIGAFTTAFPAGFCQTGVNGCNGYGCAWTSYIYVDDISVLGLVDMGSHNSSGCAGYPNVVTSTLSSPWLWYNGATTQSITTTNLTSSGYNVTGLFNGCPARETWYINGVIPTQSITITPPGVSGGALSVCAGQPIVFTASGLSAPAPTYSWYNASIGTAILPPVAPIQGTGSTYTYTPTASPPIQYISAYGTATNGCGAAKTIQLNIIPTPTAAITTSNYNMCSTSNQTGTYTAVPQSAGVIYTWSVTCNSLAVPFTLAPNGQSITVNWASYTGSSVNAQVCLTVSAPGCSSSNVCIQVTPCCVPSSGYLVISGSSDPNSPTPITATLPAGLGGTQTNTSVALNGYFTIASGTTIDWSNMRFAMAPGTRITVESGAVLKLSECHFFGCSQVWDGIYAAGGANTIRFSKYNLFEDATNAVVIQNSTILSFKNVYFNKCHIGIDFRTSATANTSGIQSCVFTSRNFGINTASATMPSAYMGNTGIPSTYPTSNYAYYAGANILPPYLPGRGHIGVNIADHAAVTVGLPSVATTDRNIFDNLAYGIHGLNSNVYVLNNLFIYIQEYCTGGGLCFEPFQVSTCPPGTAVCTGSLAGLQGPSPRATKVGIPATGTTTYPNYFESDQYGIYNGTNRNLEARDNQFKIIDKIGIYNTLSSNYLHVGTLINFPSNTLTVTGNKMDRAQTGVHFNDNRNAVMNVSSNEFNWVSWSTMTSQQSVSGIIVNNAVVHTAGSLLIGKNNIANLQKGITLTLQGYSGTGTVNRTYVIENQIRYNQLQSSTVSVQHYGVGVFSSKRITVDGDGTLGEIIRITSSASTLNNTATQRNLFNAIRVEDSPESWVTDINITNVPAGVYAKGACATSDFWCNIFTSAFNGVYLDNANVGDQLNLATPYVHAATGNQWITTNASGSKISGTASPSIFWYYGSGTNYNPNPSIGYVGITFIVADNPADACAFQTAPEDPGDPNGRLSGGEIQQNNPLAKDLDNTTNGIASVNARGFNNEPELEYYPAFLDSMGTTDAAVYNNAIVTESNGEEARKKVDEIHLRSWAQGLPEFTAADSTYLCWLSGQDPDSLGSAVYSAQVMVGECFVEDNAARLFTPPSEINNVNIISKGKIYPNPNDGLMQAEFSLKETETGVLDIFNLSGNKLASYRLNPGLNNFIINENKLQAGIYFYKVTINGVETEIQKLVIVK